MQNLNPSQLILIFDHLSIQDICRATCVCRKWCFHLWRDDDQQRLWLPKVSDKLQKSKRIRTLLAMRVVDSHAMKRMLPYKSVEEICDYYNMLNDHISMERSKLASAISRSSDFYKVFLYTKDDTYPLSSLSSRTRTWTAYKNIETAQICLYTCRQIQKENGVYDIYLYCTRGEYQMLENSGSQKITGELVLNGRVAYKGEIVDEIPSGTGIMILSDKTIVKGQFHRGSIHGNAIYYENEFIKYDGEWVMGMQHGQGTMYHDDSTHKLFVGTYNHNEATEGTWFDDDEKQTVVHHGQNSWFDEMLKQQTLKNHVCSYTFTKKCFVVQPWWNCTTCYNSANKGCCAACANKCHKGHNLVMRPASQFFCDCGADPEKCKAYTACETEHDCGCESKIEYGEMIVNSSDDSDSDSEIDYSVTSDDEPPPLVAVEEEQEQEHPQQNPQENLEDFINNARAQNKRVFLEIDEEMKILGVHALDENN